jgi:hypothetical protein
MSTSNIQGWPPTASTLPDLSALNQNKMLILAAHKIVGVAGLSDFLPESLRINYIRVTDRLIHEYENARLQLNQYLAHQGSLHISPLFLATGHFESAVTNMVRAIDLAQRIRKVQNGPPIAKHIEVLHGNVRGRVGDLRNAIEHIFGPESNIVPPAWLVLKDQGCELEGLNITYVEFARWISQLDKIAADVVLYKGPPPSAAAGQT